MIRFRPGSIRVAAVGAFLLSACADAGDSPDPFPCTEEGVRLAIAVGGGPHTFACEGPTTIVTKSMIAVDTNAILDGRGELTLDGDDDHGVFFVPAGVTAMLRGLTVTGGRAPRDGGGIRNEGTLTLADSTVSGNSAFRKGGGIWSSNATLTVANSRISGNSARDGGGIWSTGSFLTMTDIAVVDNSASQCGGVRNSFGSLTLTSSVVSENVADINGGGVCNGGSLELTNSTLSSNTAGGQPSDVHANPLGRETATIESVGTTIVGKCEERVFQTEVIWISLGGNVESPGDTCGFDHPSDRVNVAPGDLEGD